MPQIRVKMAGLAVIKAKVHLSVNVQTNLQDLNVKNPVRINL